MVSLCLYALWLTWRLRSVRRFKSTKQHAPRHQCELDPSNLRKVKFGLRHGPRAPDDDNVGGAAGDLAGQSVNTLDAFCISDYAGGKTVAE